MIRKAKLYISRAFRYITCGIPKVYVKVSCIQKGDTLKGKKIVITGASSGIGYATAKKCLIEGASVLCVARSESRLDEAINSLKNDTDNNEVYALPWDISDVTVCEKKVQKAIEILGGSIDCLVNSAGITSQVNIRDCTNEEWDKIFNINLKGLYFLTSGFLKQMAAQPSGGSIVNVASQAGMNAQTRPYALSKAALIHLTYGIAKEYASQNIRSNAVAPGPTVSGMMNIDPNGDLSSRNRQGRSFRAEEVAETIVFLISDAARCITGECIACNGGNSIRTDAFC